MNSDSDSVPAPSHQPVGQSPPADRITVVVPTYNEAHNLPQLVADLFGLPLPGLRLLVVDDSSPDGTGALADQLAAQVNDGGGQRMAVLHRPAKSGLGTAYVQGMTQALAADADYVVQMDADFSHSPHYIPQMLAVMQATGVEVVVGSRYAPGGSLDPGWSWWRRFLSWWANLYSRLILGIRVRDMTAGFKLWRREALLGVALQTVRSNGYSFQVEMAYLCERLGYRIIEVPIHFEDRRIGKSKMDVPVKLESAWRVPELRWRYRHLRRRPTTHSQPSLGVYPAHK